MELRDREAVDAFGGDHLCDIVRSQERNVVVVRIMIDNIKASLTEASCAHCIS